MNKSISNGRYITGGDGRPILNMKVVLEFDDNLVSVKRAKDEYLDLLKMIVDDPEDFLLVKNI